jgi:hypothetical protein
LGQVQRLGGAGQTALIMDGAQAAQVPKLKVHLD